MAYVNFYVNPSGNDLNSGSTAADAGGSDSPVYTSVAGNFDGTSVFTPTDGSTPASTVSAGMYVSLYNTGDTVARCVAKVVSVAAGVNGAITVDTTIKYGTVPTSNSGSRALKCGGAFASILVSQGTGPFLTSVTAPQSTQVYVKAGTYAQTTNTRSIGPAGTATVGVVWIGYKTTPGDQETNNVAVAGTDIPSITFTTGSLTGFGVNVIMKRFAISGAKSGAAQVVCNASGGMFIGCQITNTSATASSHAASTNTGTMWIGCTFSVTATTTASGLVTSGTGAWVLGSVFTGGSTGVSIGISSFTVVERCVFNAIGGDAISTSTGSLIARQNTIYAPTGNGINITGAPAASAGVQIANNLFSTVNQASMAGINNTSGTNITLIRAVGNAYWNCTANTSGITEGFTVFDNATLASDPLVAPGSGNFTLNPIAQGIGFPGLFPSASLYQGYLDVGAVQHAGAGANLSRVFSGF